MSLLTLISKIPVRLPAKRKVLKAHEFSAITESKQLIEKTREEALEYRKEVSLECEKLKEQAEKEGFDAGLRKWDGQLKLLDDEIKKVREEMEKAIVPLALTAAKKIVGREIELSKETVVDIVGAALKPVSQHRKVTIYVNPQDLEILEKERKRLKDIFEHLESLSIIPREDVTPQGCVIETEAGIINARLEKQWEGLEEAFKTLLKEQKK